MARKLRARLWSFAKLASCAQRSACPRNNSLAFAMGAPRCASPIILNSVGGIAFRTAADIRQAAMQRTNHDRYVALQTFFGCSKTKSELLCGKRVGEKV